MKTDLDDKDRAALIQLQRLGYDVAVGLDRHYAKVVSLICRQPHIVEYCPGDSRLRFADLTSTRT